MPTGVKGSRGKAFCLTLPYDYVNFLNSHRPKSAPLVDYIRYIIGEFIEEQKVIDGMQQTLFEA